MPVADPPIQEDQLAVLEAYFRRVGLPELSRNIVRATMTRREALLGGPVILFGVACLVAYFWTALPRWLWPILFIVWTFFQFKREDIQRARLSNLSGRALLVIVALYSALIGFGVWHGRGPLFLFVLLAVGPVLRAVVGAGFVPVELLSSLFKGILSARQVAAAIPAMLAVVLFVFVTADAWKLFGLMDLNHFILGLVGIGIIILTILWIRLRRMTLLLAEPTREWAADVAPVTEADTFLRRQVQLPDEVAKLPLGARRNIINTLTLLSFIRLIGASAVIAMFFVLIGVLIIDPAQTQTYLGSPHYASVVSVLIDGHQYLLSSSLIKVATWLAVLAALFFAIVALEDSSVLKAFIGDKVDFFQGIVAAWAYYDTAADCFKTSEVSPEGCPQGESEDAAEDSIGTLLNEGARKLDAGDSDGAEECWLQELYSPDSGVRRMALFNLGMLSWRAGLRLEAKEYYQRAADQGHAEAASNLALMLRDEGNIDEAKEMLRRIIDGGFPEGADPERVKQAAHGNLILLERNRVWKG